MSTEGTQSFSTYIHLCRLQNNINILLIYKIYWNDLYLASFHFIFSFIYNIYKEKK